MRFSPTWQGHALGNLSSSVVLHRAHCGHPFTFSSFAVPGVASRPMYSRIFFECLSTFYPKQTVTPHSFVGQQHVPSHPSTTRLNIGVTKEFIVSCKGPCCLLEL